MVKLYHNNKKVIEIEKIGRGGQKMSKAIEEYLLKVVKDSSKNDVHIFKLEGNTFTHISTLIYNPKTSRWNYKTIAKF